MNSCFIEAFSKWLSLLCIMHLMCNLIGKDDVQPRAAIYQVLWLQIVNIVCHNETIPSRKIFIFLQYGIKYRCPKNNFLKTEISGRSPNC